MQDYLKEPIAISNVLLWRLGWYKWSGNTKESILNDIKLMLELDGYCGKSFSEDDVYFIITNQYEEYAKWAIKNDIPGWYRPVSELMRGTYQRLYPERGFLFNAMMEMLSMFSNTEKKYLCIKKPIYGKGYPVSNDWKPGMTYKTMQKEADRVWSQWKWNANLNTNE